MSSCFDLPEDVIVKILCRLPVKSLIRFTCVSKRWSSIISDPKFGKSHFQLASQQGTLSRKVLITSYPAVKYSRGPNSRMLTPRFQSLEDNLAVRDFIFPSEEHADMKEMGSCNGLVLIGQLSAGAYEKLYIWNLSTGFFRKISNPSFRLQFIPSILGGLYFINHGFGYVSACDDYKIVFIIPDAVDLVEVHVLSLRANVWKVIKAPYSSWPGQVSGQGVVSNGAVHLVSGRLSEGLDVIYAFDLAEEKFRRVPLPHVLLQNEVGNPTEIKTLVHLGGSLCIWSSTRYHGGKNEVWALKEYGVPESWVKLFQFDLHKICRPYFTWDLCFITENDTMVLRLNKDELCWIECRNEERPFCIRSYKAEKVHSEVLKCSFFIKATAYDETLASVVE